MKQKNTPYFENDQTNPINYYGKTKLDGEEFIKSNLTKYYIFRTTWVIGRKGKNFAKTILNLAQNNKELKIVNDQFGVPTSTNLISRVTKTCIESINASKPWPSGIYNLATKGRTNWYEVAKYLLETAIEFGLEFKSSPNSVLPIDSGSFSSAAKGQRIPN